MGSLAMTRDFTAAGHHSSSHCASGAHQLPVSLSLTLCHPIQAAELDASAARLRLLPPTLLPATASLAASALAPAPALALLPPLDAAARPVPPAPALPAPAPASKRFWLNNRACKRASASCHPVPHVQTKNYFSILPPQALLPVEKRVVPAERC
ncbi:unnamed protein product [Mortierella alpina]